MSILKKKVYGKKANVFSFLGRRKKRSLLILVNIVVYGVLKFLKRIE